MVVGCTAVRETQPARTATEQLILSHAVIDAVRQIEADAVAGKKVMLDLSYLKIVDVGFTQGELQEVHSLLLAAHLQICKIMDGGRSSVSLSDREREVLEWMGRGKSSGDIATILEISPETVRTYTRRIYDKLQTNDRVTATVRALKLGLVDL